MESQAIVLIVAFLYFIPWIVALRNSHRHATGIFLLNLFLGFTGIGWLIALIWAVVSPQEPQSDTDRMIELFEKMEALKAPKDGAK